MAQAITQESTNSLIDYRQYCQGQSDCRLNKSRQSDNEFYQLGYTEVLASKLNKGDTIYYCLGDNNDHELFVKGQLHYKISNFFWHIIDVELVENNNCNQKLLENELRKPNSNFIHVSKIKRHQNHDTKHT